MAKVANTNRLRNLARGGENYRHLRWRVFTLLTESAGMQIAPLTEYLSTTFFSLRSSPHQYDEASFPLHALPMLDRDWSILQRLALEDRKSVREAYLKLVVQYVISNSAAVQRVSELENLVSKKLLSLEIIDISNAIDQVRPTDRQSLFIFKLQCALNADRHGTIADYFAKQPHSDWVRQRFLYPLIFYFINLPTKETFDQVLGQTFPSQEQSRSELELVKLLVADDAESKATLAFKCYSALLCHPFDALQILIAHFELTVAQGRVLDEVEIRAVRQLHEAIEAPRLSTILKFAEREHWRFESRPTGLPICANLALEERQATFLEQFISFESSMPEIVPNGVYEFLARMRWHQYPTQADFQDAVAIARRYGFSEGGRLLGALLTSLYMVERRGVQDEYLHLMRQLHLFGVVSPYVLCSPRGAMALQTSFILSRGDVERDTDQIVQNVDLKTRWWIKRLHWYLRVPERSMKISEWVAQVRNQIPLSGNSRYLSGIDWSWIDGVIKALRIKPFQGQVDGIYVLLVRAIEQRQREPNPLMLALDPLKSEGARLIGFVASLIREYEADAVAFVRFFLTPSMILKMRLEANYTAALSERLNALELCAAACGFNDDIMTAEQFAYEQRTLTTALTFISVGSAQFELPWEIFGADVLEHVADEFKTYLAVNKTYNELPLLSDARTKAAHVFRNKEVRTYEFKNREWPLVLTVCRIVDAFLSHPSYGIESILAIRIRHDNLRREFAVALSGLRRTRLPGVMEYERDRCLSVTESQIYTALQSWIDAYMHTKKVKLQRGIFEFLPDQAEMATFVTRLRSAGTLEEVVEFVIQWLRDRLESSLLVARAKLLGELQPALRSAIQSARLALKSEGLSSTALDRVTGTAETLIMRKASELHSWFEAPRVARRERLLYPELKMAVEGRFHDEVAAGRLIVSFEARDWVHEVVPPEMLRSAFDLWCELTMNALKYSHRAEVRMRIHQFNRDDVRGLVFSSLRSAGEVRSDTYIAEPTSVNEPMLKAGKSGLKIVSALSASILRRTAEVCVVQRQRSFHVFVPLALRNG